MPKWTAVMNRPAALMYYMAWALIACAGHRSACAGEAPDPAVLRQSSFAWTQPQREYGFAHWSSIFSGRVVDRGSVVRALPAGPAIPGFVTGQPDAAALERFLVEQKVAGLLVLQRGAIRLERYTALYPPAGRWISQSVAKTITGTLVGVALRDRYLSSLDDPVTKYLAGLKGSAYDGVTVRHLLTMTSGVRWDEGYSGAASDLAHFYVDPVDADLDATVSFMRRLPRAAPPGTRWNYNTGDIHLLGVLVNAATRRALADYLSERIWAPYGMEQWAWWGTDRSDQELGGCCLQATLRDYARFGQFVLEGGRVAGRTVVPDGWFADATTRHVDTAYPGWGYGYLWWVRADGTFDAIGIHGQLLHVDPKRQLIVVISSAWPEATSITRARVRDAMIDRIAGALLDATPPDPAEPAG